MAQQITFDGDDPDAGETIRDHRTLVEWCRKAGIGLIQWMFQVDSDQDGIVDFAAALAPGTLPVIPQLDADPDSPAAETAWVLKSGSGFAAGEAMGVLGLTYAGGAVTHQFSYRTKDGETKRITLS